MSDALNEDYLGPDPDGESPRRILIVDDMPMFRELETLFLARHANILTAGDGTEALVVARRERPDIVVTDLSMREMDGDELCRQIRNDPDLRRIPVVIVTGGRSSEHERAVRAGADDVIEKPLNRMTVLQVVHRFLRLTVRGLQRVPLETQVRLSAPEGHETWAWSRNISRGGMFVEADQALEPDTELELEFVAPDSSALLHPTARVVWRRPPCTERRPGMGLQFLRLDREAARWLDEYVYELASDPPLPGPVAAG
jgi:uncharacterized protein (TIGR02266 family)